MGIIDTVVSRIKPAELPPKWVEACIVMPDATYEGEMVQEEYHRIVSAWVRGDLRATFGMMVGGKHATIAVELNKVTSLVGVAKAVPNE